jgi:uncharacterized membrane protein YfcA
MDFTYLYILALTVAASFIQRVSGFGFGIFVMMFFPFILPSYGESITLSGLLAGTTALLIALRNIKYIRWDVMWIIVLFNVSVSWIAIEYMASIGNETLKRCLGVMLVLISLYFMFFDGKIKMLLASRMAQATVGAISGFMGGVFAMPGPPVVLYAIGALGDKRQYIATLQAFSVVFNIFYTIFRARVGFFGESTLDYWGVGLIGLVVGAWLGARCFEYIGRDTLKRIVYIMMMASGIAAIV